MKSDDTALAALSKNVLNSEFWNHKKVLAGKNASFLR